MRQDKEVFTTGDKESQGAKSRIHQEVPSLALHDFYKNEFIWDESYGGLIDEPIKVITYRLIRYSGCTRLNMLFHSVNTLAFQDSE